MAHIVFGPGRVSPEARTTPRLAPPDRSNKCWTIRWAVKKDDGRWLTQRISTRRKDRRDAERVYNDWMKGFLAQNPARTSRTLAELADQYLAEHAAPRQIERTQRNALRAPLSAVGEHETHTLDGRVWDKYIQARLDGHYAGARKGPVSTSTVRRELSTVSAMLNWAARRGRVDPQSVNPIPLPDASPRREVWLDEDEAEDILARAEALSEGNPELHDLHVALFLFLFTGARRGAVLELTWDRVDLRRGVIDFRDPAKRTGRKRRAVVPLAKRLRPVLEARRDARRPAKTAKVVTDVHPRTFDGRFAAFMEAAGHPEITPHALRHTFITLRLRAGVDPWKLAGVVSEDLRTMLTVYGHHRPDHLADAVDI